MLRHKVSDMRRPSPIQVIDHDADNAIFQDQDAEMSGIVPETPSSRLTSHIISLVLPLLAVKDKIVRFRCTQIVAHLINTLDAIDDELFHHIRLGLLKRLRDKESNVRVQAVYGLGRLAGDGEDEHDEEDSDDDSSGGVLTKLLDILQNDPSAEVRRSLLLNLPLTPTTLPYLLERARDLDAGIRRALYGRLLPTLGDFRHLSLTHREKLLRWGLRDRDEIVRRHASKLFRERWIEDCARPRDESGQPVESKAGEIATPSLDGLLELLERIDVVSSGNAGGVALDAMHEFWDGRPDYRDRVTFDEEYWKELTPESAFVVRTFNSFCRQEGASDLLSEKIPEVTRFAFLIQSNINRLVELEQKVALQEEGSEEDTVHQEFIVEQLLHVAMTLDYSDEMGRRQMFSLMREALATADVPEETTNLVVEVLRMTCGNGPSAEREFCGVVLEAIAEVHDTIMGDEPEKIEEADESFHSARSEMSGDSTPKNRPDEPDDEARLIREIMVNMKCLHIAQCMLQNVNCNLEDNAHLMTLLNNLVVPAVRSQEAPIRERGFLCLGLCCLLDKKLADENLPLFLHCFSKGHEQLQNISIQVIGDILASHPALLIASPQMKTEVDGNEPGEVQEHPLHRPVHKMFSKALKSPSAPLQTTACTSLSKLMLSTPSSSSSANGSILNQDELLKLLVIAYFDPESTANPALRQALSYFIPVYCYSRRENMARMGRIALPVLGWCLSMKEEMDVEADDDASSDMVGLAVVIAHLADWTDGRKLVAATSSLGDDAAKDADGDVHLDLAGELLEKSLGVSSKEERKTYISLLGKLYITHHSDQAKLAHVSELVQEAIAERVVTDGPSRTTLTKVEASLLRASTFEPSTPRRPRASVAPSIYEGEGATPAPSSAAPAVVTEEEDHAGQATPVPSPEKRAPAPRRTTSHRPSADEDATETESQPAALQVQTPTASPRKKAGGRPKRAAAPLPVGGSSSERAESKENRDPAPRGRPKRSAAPTLVPGGREDVAMSDAPPLLASPTKMRTLPASPVKVKLEPGLDDAGSESVGGLLGQMERVELKGEIGEEVPVKAKRGRPARGAARKSVRASRRALEEDEEEE